MKNLLLLTIIIAFGTGTLSASEELDLYLKNPATEKQACVPSEASKDGRVPAADACDTARELMSLNVASNQFQGICQSIVKNDPVCKKLDPSKQLTCSSKGLNTLENSANAQIGQRALACIKGFVVDSMVELVKFLGEMIKLLYNGAVNNAADIARFFYDPAYAAQVMGRAGSATASAVGKGAQATAKAAPAVARKAGNLGEAFIKNSIQYVGRDLPKSVRKHNGNVMAALDETLRRPLTKFLLDSTEAVARFLQPEYDCMNGVAKVNTVCRLFGELVMPPTIIFAFMKYGVNGLKAIANTPKVKRFRSNFVALNGAKKAPPAARQTVSAPKPAPKPAVVVRAESAKKPVGKMKDTELTELARTERAEARRIAATEDQVKITQDLNAKSLQESEQILSGLRERAVIARGIETGKKFPEVEDGILKASAQNPVEVNLSIMAGEDVTKLDEALRALGANGDGFPLESYPPQGLRTIKITSPAQAKKLQELMKQHSDLFVSAKIKTDLPPASSVLASIQLPAVDNAAMMKMMEKSQFDTILLKVEAEKRIGTATALKVLEQNGGVKGATQTYQKYENTFKMIRGRSPANDKTSEAYLAAFIVKQKKAGVSDDVIKKKIDEAFDGCK